MPKIIDNIENLFSDALTENLESAKRVDYCVGYFNLRGWNMVSDKINILDGANVVENGKEEIRYCRLLIGMTKSPKDEFLDEFTDPDELFIDNKKANSYRKRLAVELSEQLTFGVPTIEHEKTLQTLLDQLKSGKVIVKLFLKHQLHAKLYLTHCNNNITPIISLLGSSNFTMAGLSKQGELNVDVLEQDAAIKLDRWFNARWLDRWCIDITKDLIVVLENSWARKDLIPPFLIYMKIAYHLSREARAGLSEYKVSREFSKELLGFQQAAVKIAAHHLHKHRGIMIGDVVGLGKTITASAIAKIFEDDLYYNTLIICPKNLVSMWNNYREKYGLHASVLSQSLLRRELPNLKRYKLMIIDESHNFRNNLGETYRALKTYIDENDCKVILLSATPYNKSYIDLSNQLKLFLPDDFDLGISPEMYIRHQGGITQFNAIHPDTNARTINAFEKSWFTEDWQDIMKIFLIRRTRSFIKHNHAETDLESGRKYIKFSTGEKSFFPDRKPKKVEFSLDKNDRTDQYALLYDTKVIDVINNLNLPRYGLQLYFDYEKKQDLTKSSVKSGNVGTISVSSEYAGNTEISPTTTEEEILANLSRAGKRVIGFCRTNLYKRLESSGFSFMLSLSRHILRNYIFLYAVTNGFELPVSGHSVDIDIYSDKDDDEDVGLNMDFSWDTDEYEAKAIEYYALFSSRYRTKFKWIRSTLFQRDLLEEHLKGDIESLLSIINQIDIWVPQQDRKLIALEKLISETHKNKKVLIFTQYADTANYIFHEMKARGHDDHALAIGGNDDIVKIVSMFSPVSNECVQSNRRCGNRPYGNERKEIRILISTDVLSEGQNLQDAHIIVNFDLPWALVRLIQRVGRVDRLGQKSPEILCYSFLPEEGIEKIIRLREKLKNRISQNAEVVGSDEVFFEGDPINISDIYNERSNILDEEDDTEVDLGSQAYQIWKNAIDKHPDLKKTVENMPDVVFSAKENTSEFTGDNVIVYAQSKDGVDSMVLVDSQGEIISHSQYAILKTVECEYTTPAQEKLDTHHEIVQKGVEIITKETANISGALGSRKSVKYRTFMRLQRFLDEFQNTVFAPVNLKFALDMIYKFPLKERVVDTLSRQMKAGISDELLADLVVSLYEADDLCSISSNSDMKNSTQIICSMSLRGMV